MTYLNPMSRPKNMNINASRLSLRFLLLFSSFVFAISHTEMHAVEAESYVIAERVVTADAEASGQSYIKTDKSYQPLMIIDVPQGAKFTVRARVRGMSICLKNYDQESGEAKELKWNYSRPEEWTWVTLGDFTREQLGDKVLLMSGGTNKADAGLDAVEIAAPEVDYETISLNLWEGNPPGVVSGAGPGVCLDGVRLREVGIPSMTLYLPKECEASRPVLLVCPGGGYKYHARFATGNGTLEDFLPRGVVVAVLRYRTSPPYDNVKEVALLDAQRAVRLLRENATEWGIDPERIAVAGWSAGGNLALNLATHFDGGDPMASDSVERKSSRPDAVALLCPAPMGDSLGDFPVPADAPPAFIASALDDTTAPTAFAVGIAEAFQTRGIPEQLWVIDEGGHSAFSEGSTGEGAQWDAMFWTWMTQRFPKWDALVGKPQQLSEVDQEGLKAEDASLIVADSGTGPREPVTAEIVIHWDRPTVMTTRNQFSLNGSDSGSAAHTADPRYAAAMDYMHPGHVRYHKHIVHGRYDYRKGGVAGWLNYDTRTWDRDTVKAAFESYRPEDAEILIAISEWPTWMDKDGDKLLDNDQYDAYAQLCAELVELLNVDLKLGIKQFEVSNERDFVYWRAQRKEGKPIQVSELADIFNRCAVAMKAVDPSVQVGGPTACRAEDSVLSIHETFVRETLPNLDFYSFHVYSSGDPGLSNASIYDSVSSFGEMIDSNREMLDRVSPDRFIPIHLNEYNIFWTWKVNEPRMRNHVGAVFDSLFMVEAAQHGLDVANAWNECDSVYGKINDKDFSLRPGAHAYHFFNNWLVGQAVEATTDESQAVVPFAVESAEGHSFVLINRSSFTNRVDLYFVDWEPQEAAVTMARIDENGLRWQQVAVDALDSMTLPPDSVTFFLCK